MKLDGKMINNSRNNTRHNSYCDFHFICNLIFDIIYVSKNVALFTYGIIEDILNLNIFYIYI